MIEAQYLDFGGGFIGIDLFGIPDVYTTLPLVAKSPVKYCR